MSTAEGKAAKRKGSRRTSTKKSEPGSLKNFVALTRYMETVAHGTMFRHTMFSLCVKASASKCFELNLAIPQAARSKSAFFMMSSLRGICEDLIVLRYIGKMPSSDRENLIAALSSAELGTRTKLQDEFFTAVRPQQPVLRLQDVDAGIANSEAQARSIWNKHDWPNLSRGSMPQIRQIAEKQGLHQLAVLYDYLYRLTSAAVHFNVQSLLRSGWGPKPKVVFSTKNFDQYFANFCELYGAFLFCLYFEFFGSVLRPSEKVQATVSKIREEVLMTPRWPEIGDFRRNESKASPIRTRLASALVGVSSRVTKASDLAGCELRQQTQPRTPTSGPAL